MITDPEFVKFEVDFALEQLPFPRGVRLTLIARDPARPGAVLIFGNDDKLRQVLERYFAQAKEGEKE